MQPSLSNFSFPSSGLKFKTLILDIDRTLNPVDPEVYVQKGLRMGLARWDPRQWDLYEEIVFDTALKPLAEAQEHHAAFAAAYDRVIILSSRKDEPRWRFHTEAWLEAHHFHYDLLIMRPTTHMTVPSCEIKEQLITPHLGDMNVADSVYVDDDTRAVQRFRSLGFNAFESPHQWGRVMEFSRSLGRLEPSMPTPHSRPLALQVAA